MWLSKAFFKIKIFINIGAVMETRVAGTYEIFALNCAMLYFIQV